MSTTTDTENPVRFDAHGDPQNSVSQERVEATLSGCHVTHLTIPLWLPTSAALLLPIVRVGLAAGRRARPGHCRRCGYDLRASPERCPE